MAYTNPLQIINGLQLDFIVAAATPATDNFLGVNAAGEVTAFSSVPATRVSAGGNITEATSSVLTIVGGTAAALGAVSIQVKLAGAGQSGYLASADWTTFNNKLSGTLASANLFVGNGSSVATAVAITGDITINNAGLVAIASGVIVNADIHATAAIAFSKMAATTASRALVTDGSGFAVVATTTASEIGYVNGVTSSIQNQLNGKLSATITTPSSGQIISYNGSAWVNTASTALPSGGAQYAVLRKATATDFDTEWHLLVAANLTDLSATAAELNLLSGVTTTGAQLNFLNSTSSDVQSQLDQKLSRTLTTNSMYVGVSNIATAFATGANGYVLTSVGGVPTWVNPGVGGTVTSINVTGGTTGLTTSGGPITTNGTIVLAGTLIAANGGTGFASYTVGDILYANTTTTLAKLAASTINYVLTSGGAGVAPSWQSPSGSALSALTAATGSNTINNGVHAQEWQWNTLASSTGLKLSTTSTAANSGVAVPRVLHITSTGAHASSAQTSVSLDVYNGHSGTTSENIALYVGAESGTTNYAIWVYAGHINLAASSNLVLATGTGTKIGTGTNQKLGFWNATPVIQPTTGISASAFVANSGTAVNDASTFDGYTVKQIAAALRQIGILA